MKKRTLDDEHFDLMRDTYLEERMLLRICEPKTEVEKSERVVSSLDEFAVMVAVNDEVDFLEERVRGIAARLASSLNDDDELFKIDFSNGTTEDKIRYCTEMIPMLLKKLDNKKAK
jgi:hypothetical protein